MCQVLSFTATRLAEKWVSDLVYVKTQESWLYLTAVLDLADRKVVDWAMSQTMEAEVTTVAAWQMAVSNRPITKSLLFHSDRGVQYLVLQMFNLNHFAHLVHTKNGNTYYFC